MGGKEGGEGFGDEDEEVPAPFASQEASGFENARAGSGTVVRGGYK